MATTLADCTDDSLPPLVHAHLFSPSRYTGKERDAESGLDYFGARYYGSNMGRWMSPRVPHISLLRCGFAGSLSVDGGCSFVHRLTA